ncbi:hypothetical protein BRAS3843_240018 [Bradyrhizobium sp. STM 3843]|nr:hypothetical protein BRAS3843_240018 [Bradyrhizobium sp. STM 3843]
MKHLLGANSGSSSHGASGLELRASGLRLKCYASIVGPRIRIRIVKVQLTCESEIAPFQAKLSIQGGKI